MRSHETTTLGLRRSRSRRVPRSSDDDPLLISSDVPTTESATLTTLLQTQIFRYDTPPAYTLLLTVPGNPQLDGIHKMDRFGSWLFSVEAANNLAGVLGGADADPRDVIRFDATGGRLQLLLLRCGRGNSGGRQRRCRLPRRRRRRQPDRQLRRAHDRGSRSRSTRRTWSATSGSGPCAGTGPSPRRIRTSTPPAAGVGIPTSVNMLDAARVGALRIFSLDVPADLGPPGVVTLPPGQIVSWNGAAFALYEPLAGMAVEQHRRRALHRGQSGRRGGDALHEQDRVPSARPLGRDPLVVRELFGGWPRTTESTRAPSARCYSHTSVDCNDGGAPLTEQITPSAGLALLPGRAATTRRPKDRTASGGTNPMPIVHRASRSARCSASRCRRVTPLPMIAT